MSYQKWYLSNPMLIPIVVTMDSLRRQLDQDESRDVSRGCTPPHTMTASHFIWDALQIEEQQYVPLEDCYECY